MGAFSRPALRRTISASSSGRIELQPSHDAEAVAQRIGEHAGAGGSTHQGEGLQVELDRAGRRALADHDVDLVVLQRRVEDFLHDRRQAVDLVDEQDVVLFQVGQQRRQVLGLFQHRPGGLAQVHAQFVRDDVRQRGLAQARRAEQQHMVQRLAPLARGADEDLQLLAGLGLAHVVVEQLGPQRPLHRFLVRRGGCGRHHRCGGGISKSSVWMATAGSRLPCSYLFSALSASLMPSLTPTSCGSAFSEAAASLSL
jgi:hypothetical protein